jgi:hypothetical protein
VTPSQKEAKPKTTINLGNLFNPTVAKESKQEVKPKISYPDSPIKDEELKQAWARFAETRKSQVAEHHLLTRGFQREGSILTIHLENAIEEPLLQSIKPDLVSYLRERTSNNSLQIRSHLREMGTNRVAYTNKEKFEAMAEKNPLVIALRDKFALDPDF